MKSLRKVRVNGLNLIFIRGETANLELTLSDAYNRPFLLPPKDMFDDLSLVFRVKRDPYTITSTYVITKTLPLNDGHRFDENDILDLKTYLSLHGGTYSPTYLNGCTLPSPFPNILFYHPDLKQYVYNDGAWRIYAGVSVTIPFTIEDTVTLDYGDYYYDVALIGKNTGLEDYVLILIKQNVFTVDYKV